MPPVRLGRIVSNTSANDRFITTEATLVGGDSGGPVFNMYGQVIGIHSRINNPLTANMSVPTDAFTRDWERLLKGERWGNAGGGKGGKGGPAQPSGFLGVLNVLEFKGPGIKVGSLVTGSPAEKAGLKMNDIITSIEAKTVATADELQKRRPGDEVTLEVRRGTETLKLKATLDAAPQ
jgi:serine protease Do